MAFKCSCVVFANERLLSFPIIPADRLIMGYQQLSLLLGIVRVLCIDASDYSTSDDN